MIGVLLGFITFAVIGVAAVIVYHDSKRRIRKAQEKVYRDYLREQAILEQNYFSAYFAMLRAAEEQKKKAQIRRCQGVDVQITAPFCAAVKF